MKDNDRCDWCRGDALYESYHDNEWGKPLYDDQKLFEFLILEGAQAGLSWITVLRKRESYRAAMDNFDPYKMAHYDDHKIAELLSNPGIIRNKLKVNSAVKNANAYVKIVNARGSFSEYVWQFVGGKPIINAYKSMAELPARSTASEAMSRQLKKDGFNFVGPTICYAFMQATGMVNDHLVDCPEYPHR